MLPFPPLPTTRRPFRQPRERDRNVRPDPCAACLGAGLCDGGINGWPASDGADGVRDGDDGGAEPDHGYTVNVAC